MAIQAKLLLSSQLGQTARVGVFQKLHISDDGRQSGEDPNFFKYVAALKACSSVRNLGKARRIHAEVVESGLESVVYVANVLVDVYSKCGSMADARAVFENMTNRNVVSWNTIISGYAQMRDAEEVLRLYTRMQLEDVVPNDRTFVGVLKACSKLAASQEGNKGGEKFLKAQWLELVRSLHSDVVRSGFDSDSFVGNILIDVYVKCGSLVDARRVFDTMLRRDVVSWTAIILGYAQMDDGEQALQLFTRMEQEGVAPNDRTFVAALKACSSMATFEASSDSDGTLMKRKCLDQIRRIHFRALKSGFASDVFVATMLVDAYAKCGSLLEARCVFEKMANHTVVSWTAMILGYAQMEQGEEALHLYSRMKEDGVVPNDRTFVAALRACSSLAALEEGDVCESKPLKRKCLEQVRAIHSEAVQLSCQSDVYLGNMLVDAYAKCGSMVDARCVFEMMPQRDVVSWNALIFGYAQMDEGEEALKLYGQMQSEGLRPNDRTLVAALKACCAISARYEVHTVGRGLYEKFLDQVRAIHRDLLRSESKCDVFVENMLVDVYAKCGSLEDARLVFEQMRYRDVVSWNTMILVCAQMEQGDEALQLYSKMQELGVAPDYCTFIGVLKACTSVTNLERGKEIHASIVKNRIDITDSFLANTLIDMYGKCGSMAHAQQVFDALLTRDIVTWNTLMAGYARQGNSATVFELFDSMKKEGVQPDSVTFLCVLSLCSHVGLVDEGQEYLTAMNRDFGVSPTIEHYTCMIDLLGRAGQLDKAMALATTMPFQPDAAVWETLLSGCQKWSNVDVGRRAFECAIRLDKENSTAYVLMSNIYAAAHMWEEAKEMQAVRSRRRSVKPPGQSWWTDVGGGSHSFSVGDTRNYDNQNLHEGYLQSLENRVPESDEVPDNPAILAS